MKAHTHSNWMLIWEKTLLVVWKRWRGHTPTQGPWTIHPITYNPSLHYNLTVIFFFWGEKCAFAKISCVLSTSHLLLNCVFFLQNRAPGNIIKAMFHALAVTCRNVIFTVFWVYLSLPWKPWKRRCPVSIMIRCLTHLNWILSMRRSSGVTSSFLQMSQLHVLPLTLNLATLIEEIHFGCLYLWSPSFQSLLKVQN